MDVQHFVRSLVLLFFILEVYFSVSLSRNARSGHNHRHRGLHDARRHRRNNNINTIDDVVLGDSQVIDSGPWGPWSESSECSRSCGGGVAIQTRKCMHVRHDGSHGCVGPSKKYFSCNIQDCPEGSVDFRSEQCTQFDTVAIEGRFSKWVPYLDGPNKCELNCVPQGERVYYRHAKKVIDGTRCDQDSLDICVDGVCMPVGCDMMLGSNATEDKCRECGGDGSSCKSIEGLFDLDNLQIGYNDILLIPSGATHINIVERKPTNNYLAIRNLTGHYYLNGNWRIDFPRDLKIAGTTFHYARKPHGFQAPESLKALGPTTEPIYLVLLYQERNSGVLYEYSIPNGISPVQPDNYSWIYGAYGECSKTCGGGFQSRTVNCARSSNFEIVPNYLCESALQPPSNRSCNKEKCPPEWIIGEWEECSASCEGGVQFRMVYCQQIHHQDTPTVVNNNVCLKMVGPKPQHLRPCNQGISCPKWHAGPWSFCNKMCGPGEQSRSVTCQKNLNGILKVFPDQDCGSVKPQSKRKCRSAPCEGVDWIVSDWSGCDSCGLLRESRHVLCSNQSGNLFPKDFCDREREPEYLRDCPDGPACNAMWIATEWSECSAKCGSGIKTRSVFCGEPSEDSIKKVQVEQCDAAKKLEPVQNCSSKPCKGVWFSGPWDKCDVLCGGGEQSHKVVCLLGNEVVDAISCDSTEIPLAKQECNTKPCGEDEKPEKPENGDCKDSEHGCCPDNVTIAGPGLAGCPTPTAKPEGCAGSEFGCCPDGETPAEGPFKKGCEEVLRCEDTKNGCCPDGVTAAKGSKNEGCPDPTICHFSKHGCCPDGLTVAKGINYAGCSFIAGRDCNKEEFGCCPDEFTPALGPNFIGCVDDESSGENCQHSFYGCCPDGITPSLSPLFEGCPSTLIPVLPDGGFEDDCENTPFGCCPDLINAAEGENNEGCPKIGITPLPIDCNTTTFGCCPDNVTEAKGFNNEGCDEDLSTTVTPESDCENTLFGCCPDGKTSARDSKLSNCGEDTSTGGDTTIGESTTGTGDTTTGAGELIKVSDGSTSSPGESTTGTGESTTGTGESTTGSGESTTGSGQSTTDTGESTTGTGDSTTGTGDSTTGTGESTTGTEGLTTGTGELTTGTGDSTTGTGDSTTGTGDSTTGTGDSTTGTGESTTGTKGLTTGTGESTTGTEGLTTGTGESTTGGTSSYSTDITTSSPSVLTTLSSEDCAQSEFGCCEDGITPATGPSKTGCPQPVLVNCAKFKYGCCPDGLTEATGPKQQGCLPIDTLDCQKTKFGCCPDKKSEATGPGFRGCHCESMEFGCCPDGINFARGENYEGCGCEVTAYGCCPDGITDAKGPDKKGCGCQTTKFGCCPDGENEATGSNYEGCCDVSPFGCCPDQKTIAQGPDNYGCGCEASEFGCCPDKETPAQGPDDNGCDCEDTEFGCCPDEKTPASGTNYAGCPCSSMPFGCCPDNVTPAQGEDNFGCDCQTTTYGCCPDGKTAAEGEKGEGCENCEVTTYGCCPDNKTPAQGPNQEGCEEACELSRYGCCPDRKTPAQGPNNAGCEERCENTQHGCCSDGRTPSPGPNQQGCPCEASYYGCCPDNRTPALGPNQEGCEERCERSRYGCCSDGRTPSPGPNQQGCPCEASYYGCCPDNQTQALGPNQEGCEERCERSRYGCCPDGRTPAQGPNQEGCVERCEYTRYGCCPDGRTPAQGTNQEGCAERCEHTRYGCCPDRITPAQGPNHQGCVERCEYTGYGCCRDGITPAQGPNHEGCVEQCETSHFGCCPDGKTPSPGPNQQGCEETCETSRYGCCPDGKTASPGPNQQGCGCGASYYGCCPDRITPAQGPNQEGCVEACERTRYGCCPDRITPARGPKQEGCEENCERSRYGCCPDRRTPAQGPNHEGCEEKCETTRYGCCPDQKTPSSGPDQEGCGCTASYYGCCPDGITPADGPSGEGCDDSCHSTRFGCCPDDRTAALGENYEGCGCETTYYGCCPDKKTPAQGFNEEGCEACYSSEFGCCSDEKTPAQGPNQEGCGCESSRFGCCPDGVTFAQDENKEGCKCENTRYGCCPDGITAASGLDYLGCNATQPDPPVMKAGEVCGLPDDGGTCGNHTLKWFFDMSYGGCNKFWYSGCGGNENRFDTMEECEQVCVIPEGMDACHLPKVQGPCHSHTILWYYDVPSGQCGQFYYGGCLGNNNRFATQEECQRTCAKTESQDPCLQPKLEGPCSGNYRHWYYDNDETMCKEFRYGGCKGNRNNFQSERECIQQCASRTEKEACVLSKEVGPCGSQLQRWFYDIVDGLCKEFIYGGCQGNINRFPSQQHCEVTCNGTKVGDICALPKAEGPCNEQAVRWFFDSTQDRCMQFYYGGCEGNANRFETESECQRVCSAIEVTDICSLPSEHGPCSSSREERWAYDSYVGQCRVFQYGGCGGNQNNFVSERECEHRCVPSITTPDDFQITDCFLEHSYGRCDDNIVRWYYDKSTGVCKQFHYSGCNGNKNRFLGRKECEQKCSRSQDICGLPKVTGPCSGQFHQWYFNGQVGECEEFVYGGCEGNSNKFNSRDECENECRKIITTSGTPVAADPCTLPHDSGPCSSTVLSWYYDYTDTACKSFLYGGCKGNTNRFVSEESCERACGYYKGQDVCTLPQDKGSCLGSFPKWYYDPAENSCKGFVYGGCRGNGNRFNSRKECEQVCIARKFHGGGNITLSEICILPADPGPCTEEHPRWYFDASRSTCLRFNYGGCRGNSNRFKSFETCLGFCSAPTCPEPEECTLLNCPYGVEEFSDDNGCIKCRCRNPCHGIDCPAGTSCVVERKYALNGDVQGHPVCREHVKPGVCPRAIDNGGVNHGQCIDECRSDIDCEDDYKCCRNGCGMRCLLSFAEPGFIPRPDEDPDIGREEPRIEPSSDEIRIRINHTVHIPCIAHGEPRPYVYWRKDGQDLPIDDVKITFVNDQLRITNVQHSDAGSYTCIADNRHGTPAEKTTQVIVEEPAHILPGVRVIVVAVGTPCLLHCRAGGYPRPSVTWWRGYIMLPRTSERYEQFANYSLLIRSVIENDYGDYSCMAYNGIGEPAEKQFTIRNPDSAERGNIPSYTQRPPRVQTFPPFPGHRPDNPRESHHISQPGEGDTEDSGEAYYVYEDDDPPSADVVGLETPSNVLNDAERDSKTVDESEPRILPKRVLESPELSDTPVKNYLTALDEIDKYIDGIAFNTLELPSSLETTFNADPINQSLHVLPPNEPKSDSENVHFPNPLLAVPPPLDPLFQDSQIDTTTTTVDYNSVTVSAEIFMEKTVFPMKSDVWIDCNTDGSDNITWFKDDVKLHPSSRIQIMNNGTLVIYNALHTDSGNYKCEAANKYNSASSTVAVTINGFELHVNCTDNPYFANCKLVVQAGFCSNQYYARFCCKSCTLAGQLPVDGSHLNKTKK